MKKKVLTILVFRFNSNIFYDIFMSSDGTTYFLSNIFFFGGGALMIMEIDAKYLLNILSYLI